MEELEPDKRKKWSYTDSDSEFYFFIDRYGQIKKKYVESERKEVKKEIVR